MLYNVHSCNTKEKIVKILPLEQVGQNNTDKRTFILEENRDTQYKGGLAIDLRGEKIAMLDAHNEWDIVNVSLNAKVREYNGKRYNSVSAWKIEGVAAETSGWTDSEPFVPPSTDDEGLPF